MRENKKTKEEGEKRAVISFEELKFYKSGANEKIKAVFLNIFYFYIDSSELEKIAKYKLKSGSIVFSRISEKEARNKTNMLINRGFKSLKNSISNRKAIYIHKGSGIKLIGTPYFGIIDRNSSIIEIRPITSCNINCIYCSLSEGEKEKKQTDYVVDFEYITEELEKHIKGREGSFEAHIGAQGEPLLYKNIVKLVKGIKSINKIRKVSLETNGLLLNKNLIDRLKGNLDQLNISLNAITKEKADYIAQHSYNTAHVIKMAEYAIKNKIKVYISPVYIKGVNDNEIPKIIEEIKRINAIPGIQNFFEYKNGKKPAKQVSMEEFIRYLRGLEKKHNIKLVLEKKDVGVKNIKPLKKPFKKNQVITAEIVAEGRKKNEKIAVAGNRSIVVSGCVKEKGIVKLKITRDKHNIFYGKCLG